MPKGRAAELLIKDQENKTIALENLYMMRLAEVTLDQWSVKAVDSPVEPVQGGVSSDREIDLIIEKQDMEEKIIHLEANRKIFE